MLTVKLYYFVRRRDLCSSILWSITSQRYFTAFQYNTAYYKSQHNTIMTLYLLMPGVDTSMHSFSCISSSASLKHFCSCRLYSLGVFFHLHTLSVHRFSHATMPAKNIFKKWALANVSSSSFTQTWAMVLSSAHYHLFSGNWYLYHTSKLCTYTLVRRPSPCIRCLPSWILCLIPPRNHPWWTTISLDLYRSLARTYLYSHTSHHRRLTNPSSLKFQTSQRI